MAVALITGITGQDGSYLAELLLDKGYAVHGIIRRSSSFNTGRIDHIFDKLTLHYGDLLDSSSLSHILQVVQPDEVYNLGAQSHVRTSFDQPVYTCEVVAIGTLKMLEAVRDYRDRSGKDVRFYQASSSEMFGDSPPPQSETTPFRPRSPYACAKVQAFWHVVNYRDGYGLFACNGIMFNHESPRRGETFVTRKITRAATRIKLGLQEKLYLGNLKAERDWGFAGEYVKAMWLMLQADKPDDFVVARSLPVSVRAFANGAFDLLGLEASEYIEHDPRYLRPNEINRLHGDWEKIRTTLGWCPRVLLNELIAMMVDADMELARREAGVCIGA